MGFFTPIHRRRSWIHCSNKYKLQLFNLTNKFRKLKKTFTPEKKEKPNDFEKSLQNSLEQFGKMSVDELMKTDTMKKLKDTREAGEEYNKLKKAVNKVTDDDDKKKDKK